MKTWAGTIGYKISTLGLLLVWLTLPGEVKAAGGTVVAWGSNSQGQTNVPPDLTNAVGIAGGTTMTAVLKSDGTVIAWGENYQSQTNVPTGLSNVVVISAGGYHGLALKSDGIVVAWGDNASQQSSVPTTLGPAVSISAGGGTGGGSGHSLVLQNNGTVIGFGSWVNGSGQPTYQASPPVNLTNVVAVAAGQYHSLALKSDGVVVGWGSNTSGQTNVPVGLSNVVAIAAGGNMSMALKSDGTVTAWGSLANVPAELSNVVAIAAGLGHQMALRSDETVVAWGAGSQANVPSGLSNVVAIAAGGNHSLAIVDESPVSIIRQPLNAGALVASSAVFSVTALGLPPLKYQWRFDGTNIDWATNSWLILTNIQPVNEGNYDVVVSDAHSTVTSSNAFLDVTLDLAEALNATNLVWTTSTNPAWYPQTTVTHDGMAAASSGPVIYHQQATLQTTVVGPGTLTFWWMASGFSGAQYFSFYINGVYQAGLAPPGWQSKTYYLLAGTNVLQWTYNKSDTLGPGTFAGYVDQVSFTSGPTAAFVSTQPSNKTVPAGTNVTFTVTAEGTPSLTYQWRFNGTNIAGATNALLSLVNVQTNNAGSYSVTVSNAYGGEISVTVTLSVTPSAPWIVIQPTMKEMVRGGQVTFDVSARGSEPFSYQWQFDSVDISGGTDAALTLKRVQPGDAGFYRVVVSNAYGSATSSLAELRIVPSVIVAWGYNFQGISTVPPGLTNIAAISAGDIHSLALRTDGTVAAWGWDAFYVLDLPSGLTNLLGIAAGGFHSLVLKADGTVAGWGWVYDEGATVPAGLSNVTAIAAGNDFSLALKPNGDVVAWGDNSYGNVSFAANLSNVVAISTRYRHGLALSQNGSIIGWGYYFSGQTNAPPDLTNAIAVSAGQMFSEALRNDGTVVAWGYNVDGQTNIPSDLTNVVAIAAGSYHSLALKSDGALVAWGRNSSGETNVPDWLTNVVAISAGDRFSVALLNDGSPFITRPLLNREMSAGGTTILNAGVMGAKPLRYQWQLNGTNIGGATNSLLILTNVPVTVAGDYRCIVSNVLGTVTNSGGMLTVTRQPLRFDVSSDTPQMTNGCLRLRLLNLAGAGLVMIEASSDMVIWEPILINPPVVGPLEFVDSAAANYSCRFYRASEGGTFSVGPLRFDVFGKTNGGFTIGLAGLTGHGEIIIHASSNLVDWETILTNPPTVGTLQLLDSFATNRPLRFYRAEEK